ncbi:transcriptional regulator FtsR [Kineosporia babensis]|uniref:MerR family transcriptional regulator n=1 Tax=Kineosporia babensis TaxID=499548 RepID=A0A9X1NFF6_9ACTN|nr:MerR family transcriptional regulator [Kineosporia babensis]MCD5312321.1 MerR family transcriptional regulator [Kineosporia babensis]
MRGAAAGPHANSAGDPSGAMSIGAVLELLRQDFPDISISKIRYLEDQGLVEPLRTAAGYRKFTPEHVDRLRYVLGVQRDHYMPLRVIREHLDAIDAGLQAPVSRFPRLVEPLPEALDAEALDAEDPEVLGPPLQGRFSRAQLLAAAEISEAVLTELESHGLVAARPAGTFDAEALAVAHTAGELAAFGLEPRHLRAFRTAADREAGLIEQVTRGQGQASGESAQEMAEELMALCVQLHSALLKTALERGQF